MGTSGDFEVYPDRERRRARRERVSIGGFDLNLVTDPRMPRGAVAVIDTQVVERALRARARFPEDPARLTRDEQVRRALAARRYR
jgi:hypothetical protein